LSYSGKRKVMEHRQHRPLPDLSESLNPVKPIAEIKKVIVLRR
jgi:hypothetical protein